MTLIPKNPMQILKRSLAAALVFAAAPGLAAAATPLSLCAAGEQVAFSCPIAGSRKTVSLCLQPGGSSPPAARYVFGTASHPELIYPVGGAARADFRSSHLMFMGPTGGNAYSFVNANTKYILYDVAGTGLEDAGILVQPVGQAVASTEMKCRTGTAANSLNGDAMNHTRSWGADPDLSGSGLPYPKPKK